MTKTNLTDGEKKTLLKNYLVDDVCVKAIIDTLGEEQLDEWIDVNLDMLLVGGMNNGN